MVTRREHLEKNGSTSKSYRSDWTYGKYKECPGVSGSAEHDGERKKCP